MLEMNWELLPFRLRATWILPTIGMLFSATQTRKVEDLSRIALKKEPLYIGVNDDSDKATVEGLQQVRADVSHHEL